MRVPSFVTLALLGTVAVSALAGPKPVYAPAPAWVIPAPLDPAKAGTGAVNVLFDQQQRLEKGQVWSYLDSATRVSSEQALAQAGTITLQWQPDAGDLIVHRIAIIRDGQTIDLLAEPAPLTVIRRERGLESLSIDGVLTATMPVKGLRVGDVLRTTYSVTRTDPVMKGAMQSGAFLITEPTPVGFARARMLWPKGQDVRWKTLLAAPGAKVVDAGAYRELTVPLPLPKPADIPADAPARYRPLPLLEVSTFRDWAELSRLMAPVYAPKGLVKPGSPLAAEVDRIKAASADPRIRTGMALRSVQGNVRYLYSGLDHGNYMPQSPEKTWAVRYGDCKAKTLLLLAMLDGLGVQAEPALANLGLGDIVSKRLPSATAFNHILVRATIDGQSYWLEGTGIGFRQADLGDVPDLRTVLPLRLAGAELMTVTPRASARPVVEVTETVDMSAGIGIPAPYSTDVILNGQLAEALKAAAAQATGDRRKELIDKVVGRFGTSGLIVSRDLRFDPDGGTATVHTAGVIGGDWEREDERYRLVLDRTVKGIEFGGDRARPDWRDIPVATKGVYATAVRLRATLPDGGKGFEVEGDRALPQRLAGATLTRKLDLQGGVLTVSDRIDETAAEITPADIAPTRAALTLAQSRRLKIVAPAGYPRRWKVVRAAQAAGKLRPIEAALTTAIADATEKAPAYLARAAFRESVYDFQNAVADLDQVIAQRPTVEAYLSRARLLRGVRADARALADARAALALDPGSLGALASVASLLGEQGKREEAMVMLDERIAAGGENKARLQSIKAEVLARAGQSDAALALIDSAIAAKPGDAELLNQRCWVKGTLSVKLDTALKDCTKAIELGEVSAAALDSRAMVYFKMNRFDDALADINAALAQRPEQAGSLYLRGAIRVRQGAKPAALDDLTGARIAAPRIDEEYTRYGIKVS